jgi:hypothetical protein
MAKLKFPFWIITQRQHGTPQPVVLDAAPGYVAVFSSAEKGTAYMAGLGGTTWEFQMVSRATYPGLVQNLQRTGTKGVCLDPMDGECGATVDFEDIR